jgi:fatty-acyl-CoA synthase
LIGWLATQAIGAIHVPINFMLGASEVAYILDHAAPRMLLVGDELMPTARAAISHMGGTIELQSVDICLADGPQLVLQQEVAEDSINVAQIAYTSGTESTPKGAMLTDSGLMYEYLSCIFGGDYSSEDKTVHALPLYHCAQMHCFLMPQLLLGGKNIILDRADAAEIVETVRAIGATSFFAPPTVWIAILNLPGLNVDNLKTLQKGYYGAAIMPREVLRNLTFALPWLKLWNYYGQTEIGPLATVLRPEEIEQRPTSAGRPVLFVETRIVDDNMNDVSLGEIGEVVHRSPQLLRGYYRDPIKTAEAFKGGWFHSGDLAIADSEGFLEIVDRKKDMIKTGGENVSSREVEEVIYGHPGVAEVAVVGLSDSKWIERVCAFVVKRPGHVVSTLDIINITNSLAPFKRPKQVEFVMSLPKNPSGKVLKRELRNTVTNLSSAQ